MKQFEAHSLIHMYTTCDCHVITIAKDETTPLLSATSTSKRYSRDQNLENNRKDRDGRCMSYCGLVIIT